MSKLGAYLTISRAKIQLGTPPHPLLGVVLGASALRYVASKPALIYLALYFLLITFACNVNCLCDVHVDRKYKRYMADAVSILGKGTVKSIIVVEGIIAVFLIWLLYMWGCTTTAILALTGMLFGIIYSAEPFRVKRRGVWSPMPVFVGLYMLPVLGGWFLFKDTLPMYVMVFVAGYALLNEGITLVNTCEDYGEDWSEGIRTWAHVFGLRTTMKIALVFTFTGGLIAVASLLNHYFSSLTNSVVLFTISMVSAVLVVMVIINISRKIYLAGSRWDIERAAKTCASNMAKWFMTTRYPLLLIAALAAL